MPPAGTRRGPSREPFLGRRVQRSRLLPSLGRQSTAFTPPCESSIAAVRPGSPGTELRRLCDRDFLAGLDQTIVEALVISVAMIMIEITANCVAEHLLAEEDHLRERFFLERSHEAF